MPFVHIKDLGTFFGVRPSTVDFSYTHSTVIDFPLVALIKIANRNRIAYLGQLAEIPQAMLTQQFTTSAKCTKPPLMEGAAELFGVYSG